MLGVFLILGGLGWLGWVGWQYFGTNWVSQSKQRELVDGLEDQWGKGEKSVEVSGLKADTILRIPRFGDDYAVPVLEGVSDDVLAAGYGHFTGSAEPGKKGNYALAAHRVTHGEPLRNMDQLEPGDEVIIETKTAKYFYKLDTPGAGLTVDFSAGWVVEDQPVNPVKGGVEPPKEAGSRLITLTTCAELFHTDERWIAFGHLERVEPKRG